MAEGESAKKSRKSRPPRRPRTLKGSLEKVSSILGKGADSEAREMLQKIKEMHGDLEEKLNYVYNNLSLLPPALQKVAMEPERFLEEHEVIMKRFKSDLEKKLADIFGQMTIDKQKKLAAKMSAERGRKIQKLRGKNRWISLE